MRLFTTEEKEHLAEMICSNDAETRTLAWDIIKTCYNQLMDKSEKNKFQNHLNHAKKWLKLKEGWYFEYWKWIPGTPDFDKFKKNILLLDIYEQTDGKLSD